MSILDGFEAFVAVCDEGSIAAAGRRLGVPRATLSRQLSRLEAELGVKLLHRSTRRLVRTEAGDELYIRARTVVDDAVAARQAVRRLDGVPRGLLRVSVPGDMTEAFLRVVLRYLTMNPHVEVEIVSTARHVDLVGEGFDVAVRAGIVRDTSLIGRKLATFDLIVYGSRQYLKEHGRPLKLEDLADHDCIRSYQSGMVPQTHWPLTQGGAVRVTGRLACNSLEMSIAAVRAGQGLALLPRLARLARADTDQLEPVLEGVVGTSSTVSVVYASRATQQPKVRAFVDLLLERLPEMFSKLGREAGAEAGS